MPSKINPEQYDEIFRQALMATAQGEPAINVKAVVVPTTEPVPDFGTDANFVDEVLAGCEYFKVVELATDKIDDSWEGTVGGKALDFGRFSEDDAEAAVGVYKDFKDGAIYYRVFEEDLVLILADKPSGEEANVLDRLHALATEFLMRYDAA